ncbi:hypothetical protein OROMI_020572 [Orobanche minor]
MWLGGLDGTESFTPEISMSMSSEEIVPVQSKYCGFPLFNQRTDMNDPKFEVGLVFESNTVLRSAIRSHSIKYQKELDWERNDSNRIVVKCLGQSCPWRLQANALDGTLAMQIKSLTGMHRCSRKDSVKAASAKWIAEQYEEEIKSIDNVFNKMLLDPRGKPIIEMLEDIRMLLMKRICVNRSKADHWWGNLCPLIREKLEFLKQKSNIMTCHYNGLDGFEVKLNGGGMDKWIVSVKEKTCSCRKWQLSGYPCVHAISCLSFLGLAVEDYVNECYKRSTYVNVYRHVMQPIKGQNEWPKSNQPILLPPIPEKMPGRPKKNSRKKSSIEMQEIKAKLALEKAAETGRLGRHEITMHYSYCKIAGHNKRNCAKRIAEHGEGSGSSVGAKMNATKRRQLFKEPKETAGPSEQNPKVTKKKTIVMNTTSAITQAVSALKGTKRSRTGQHLDATTRSSKFSALTSEGGGVSGTQESVNIWGKEDVGSAQK